MCGRAEGSRGTASMRDPSRLLKMSCTEPALLCTVPSTAMAHPEPLAQEHRRAVFALSASEM